MTRLRPLLAALVFLLAPAAHAQSAGPPATAERSYPGVIRLEVDVSDVDRRIWRVSEIIPVAGPGRMTLMYPQWLPGNHAPSGQLDKLSGLGIRSGGRYIPWTRDPVDLYAFHVDVPDGVSNLEVAFQFLSPFEAIQGGRAYVSPDLVNLQWQAALLYPKGWPTKAISVRPTVILPQDWGYASALTPRGASSDPRVVFAPVTLETLVDSPLYAGRHRRTYDLDPGGASPVSLHVFAATPERATATESQVAAHRALVRQADKLFGVRRFDRYDFLLGLTDELWSGGIEHLRSSENMVAPGYFTDWAKDPIGRTLLPHEYVHSWNGKHTRPSGLEQRDLNTPVDARLLWVYEGLTDYWGTVLAARAGLITPEQAKDDWAISNGTLAYRWGRGWRSLEDTTHDPAIAYRRPRAWVSWQRNGDYYAEGALLWLEVDVVIRRLSAGARSLDDFARAFLGRPDAGPMPQLYDRAELVRALNAVQPHDWDAFFKTRVETGGSYAELRGLTDGGYVNDWRDTPGPTWAAHEGETVDLSFSLGLVARKDGTITSVAWERAAFKARLAPGVRILAVNGRAYDDATIRAAVAAKKPVELTVRQGQAVRTVTLDWTLGHQYPALTRDASKRAWVDEILAPK